MFSGNLPSTFLDRLTALIPASSLELVLESLARPPATVFRCNTLRSSVAETLSALEAECVIVAV